MPTSNNSAGSQGFRSRTDGIVGDKCSLVMFLQDFVLSIILFWLFSFHPNSMAWGQVPRVDVEKISKISNADMIKNLESQVLTKSDTVAAEIANKQFQESYLMTAEIAVKVSVMRCNRAKTLLAQAKKNGDPNQQKDAEVAYKIAQTEMQEAEEELSAAKSKCDESSASIREAAADVLVAKAELNLEKEPSHALRIALAEAQLGLAEAHLKTAKAQLTVAEHEVKKASARLAVARLKGEAVKKQ